MSEDGEYHDFLQDKDLVFPDLQEIEAGDFARLETVWQRNDQILLEILKNQKIPFFGFHGTPKSGLSYLTNLKSQDQETVLQTTTFYKVPETPRVLLDTLYRNVNYSSGYAFHKMNRANFDGPGGIVVINLGQADEGNKASFEHELSSHEAPVVSALGSVLVNRNNCDQLVAGVIAGEDVVKYSDFVVRKGAVNRDEEEVEQTRIRHGKMHFAELFQKQKIVLWSLNILKFIN